MAWRYPKEATDPASAAAVRVMLTGSLHRAEMAHFAAAHAPSMLATLPGAFAKFAATPLKLWAACEKRLGEVGEVARGFQATATHRASALVGILEAGRSYGEACAVWDASVAGCGAAAGCRWPEEGPPPAETVCREAFKGGYLHPHLSAGRLQCWALPVGRLGGGGAARASSSSSGGGSGSSGSGSSGRHFFVLQEEGAAAAAAEGALVAVPITPASASTRPIPSLPAAAEALAALPIAAWHHLRYLQTPSPLTSTVFNALLTLLAGTSSSSSGSGSGSPPPTSYASAGAALPSWQHILALLNDPTLPAQCLALTAQAAHLAEMLAEEVTAASAREGARALLSPALLSAMAPAVANSALGDVTASVSGVGPGGVPAAGPAPPPPASAAPARRQAASPASASIPIPSATAFPALALSFASVQAARRILAQRPDARAECAALCVSVWPRPGTVVANVEGGGGEGSGAAPAPPLFVMEELPALQALLEWQLAVVAAVEEAQPWDVQREQPPALHGLLPEEE
jgi:hypothetical protein